MTQNSESGRVLWQSCFLSCVVVVVEIEVEVLVDVEVEVLVEVVVVSVAVVVEVEVEVEVDVVVGAVVLVVVEVDVEVDVVVGAIVVVVGGIVVVVCANTASLHKPIIMTETAARIMRLTPINSPFFMFNEVKLFLFKKLTYGLKQNEV